jgi:hypothetical protein
MLLAQRLCEDGVVRFESTVVVTESSVFKKDMVLPCNFVLQSMCKAMARCWKLGLQFKTGSWKVGLDAKAPRMPFEEQ